MKLPRNIAVKLTAGLLAAVGLISPAFAATGTVDADGGLRMRQSAGTDGKIITSIPNGAKVEILRDAGNGWFEISYRGSKGYAADRYIDADPTTGKVTDGPLNVRSGPGTGYSRVGKLSSGKTVKVLSMDSGWYQVSSGTLSGYVSAKYIALTQTTSAPAAAQTPTAVSVSEPVSAEAPVEAVNGEAAYIRVVSGPLNVRSGPSADYEKVSRLSTGAVAEVFGLENGWYKVENGYVCADYVRAADTDEAVGVTKGDEIAQYALTLQGCKYVYGGESPKGFDCSGLTQYVYKQFGYSINRTASAQLKNGVSVSMSELQPGDLVMFKKKGSGSSVASHVGIYIGGGQFVHASAPGVGVIVSDLDSAYYTTGFVGGRRVV